MSKRAIPPDSSSAGALASSDATSTDSNAGWLSPRSVSPATAVHALVIAWSLVEPARCGEAVLLADDAPPQIVGRGGATADDGAPRARFVRQRGDAVEPCRPLRAPGLSRKQVQLKGSPAGIAFERLGRCAMSLNGVPANSGTLRVGDVLTLKNQLVLLCVRRSIARASGGEPSSHPFGGADADGIVGESETAWRLRRDLAHASLSGQHVLVLGDSGTGKELAARAIHRRSDRSRRPLVARSVAAIPGSLLDAELFGNRRDYPNAGMPEREGIVGAASGGTLFLDELGELTPELQAHLLRLLDAGGEYHRLGEATARRADLRIVAATNRRPDELKPDFAARFAVRVTVPGLSERSEDIPLLVHHILGEIAAADPALRARFFEGSAGETAFARLDPSFVELLLRRRWASHVRELVALLWASIRSSADHFLTAPPELAERSAETREDAVLGDAPPADALRAALTRHAGNQSKAYAELGLSSRFALGRLLRKHGIDPRDFER